LPKVNKRLQQQPNGSKKEQKNPWPPRIGHHRGRALPERVRTCLAAPGRFPLPCASAARCRPPLPRAWWCRPPGVGGSSVSAAMVRWGEPGVVDRGVRPPPECLSTGLRSLLLACPLCSPGFPASLHADTLLCVPAYTPAPAPAQQSSRARASGARPAPRSPILRVLFRRLR